MNAVHDPVIVAGYVRALCVKEMCEMIEYDAVQLYPVPVDQDFPREAEGALLLSYRARHLWN